MRQLANGLCGCLLLVLPLTTWAVAPQECAKLLDEEFAADDGSPNWTFASIRPEVLANLARAGGGNPLVALGDFDGDARQDVAYFVRIANVPEIAVCLSARASSVVRIKDAFCGDGIAAMRRPGSSKSTGLSVDALEATCLERESVVYALKHGAFKREGR